MTGYQLTERLRKTRRRHRLLAPTQALYYELVAICNEEQWPGEFKCSNGELCAALVMDEKTLIKHRQTLIQCGLLVYKSGQSKHKVGIYSFLTTGIIPAQTPANTPANREAYPPAQPPDLIKTIKKNLTKNIRRESLPNADIGELNFPIEKKLSKKNSSTPKIFVPPDLLEVERFFNERGQSSEEAKLAFDYYSLADWYDSKGNKVMNWQQKMISWISREDKNHKNGHQHSTSKQNSSNRAVITGSAESAGKF